MVSQFAQLKLYEKVQKFGLGMALAFQYFYNFFCMK